MGSDLEMFDLIGFTTDQEFANAQTEQVANALAGKPETQRTFRSLSKQCETLPLHLNAIRVGWPRLFREELRRSLDIAKRWHEMRKQEAGLSSRLLQSTMVIGMLRTHHSDEHTWLLLPDIVKSQAKMIADVADSLERALSNKAAPESAMLVWTVRKVEQETKSPHYRELADIVSELGITLDEETLRKRVRDFDANKDRYSEVLAMVDFSLGINQKIDNPIRPDIAARLRPYLQRTGKDLDEAIGEAIEEFVEGRGDLD